MAPADLSESLHASKSNDYAEADDGSSSLLQPGSRAVLAAFLVLFLVSGVSQPLLFSQVKFAGLGDTTCQLYMLPYYAGMAGVGLLTFCVPGKRWGELPLLRCVGIAAVDLISQVLNFSGNMKAGSAIYAVIYASVTVWCAVLSRLFLQRVLSAWQWCAIVVVFTGLAITAIDARVSGDDVFLGAVMICVGAVLHAFMYVMSECVSVRGEKIPAHINCACQALTACTIVGTWQCVYTSTHWTLIADPLAEAQTSPLTAVLLFLFVALANFLHAVTFFFLLTWIGAVSAGVIKGLQAVCVFVLAHLLFCGREKAQCYTLLKGVSLIVVVSGVLAYTYATRRAALATVPR